MSSQLPHGPSCSCTPPSQAQCPGCERIEKPEQIKHCPRCSTQYCSRDCMKKHHKKHMQECAALAEAKRIPKRCEAKPYTAICFQRYLWDRSEKETFGILRDLWRLLMEDVKNIYIWDRSTDRANGLPEPEFPHLRRFLELASYVKGFLPPWWTSEKAEECAVYAEATDDEFQWTGAWEADHMVQGMEKEETPAKLRMLGKAVIYMCTAPSDLDSDELRSKLREQMQNFKASITNLMALEGTSPAEIKEALNVYEESLGKKGLLFD